MTILAADIGGTSARLALFALPSRRVIGAETYSTKGYESAEEIVRTFLHSYPSRPAAVCIAVAGPVQAGRSQPVNIHWTVDAAELAGAFDLPAVTIVNDLVANARGIALLRGDDLAVVNRGDPGAGGNRVVVSAGTGLGEAGLVWNGREYVAVAGEGGHADFAPRSEREVALYRYLAAELDHVSYERVCCGAGLVNIYRFLCDTDRRSPGPEALLATPAEISAEAAANPRSRSAEALDLFASIYGARAGNVALSFMATGGVYLGGGIAPRNLRALVDGSFMRAFVAKGRVSALLAQMPVSVVLNDKTALIGAAEIAAELVDSAPARLVAVR